MLLRNRINRWWIAAVTGILLTLAAAPAYGQTGAATVRVAPFSVKINGVVVDNEHAAYPMLVYNDITYIPLTWDMAQALKWVINWSETDGLEVQAAVRGKLPAFAPEALKQDRTAANRMTRAGLDNPKLDRLNAEDGSLIIDVFPAAKPLEELKTNGTVYRLTTGLQADPVWSYERGLIYMGLDRSLYWLDPDSNTVTDIRNNKTAHWRDYELMEP